MTECVLPVGVEVEEKHLGKQEEENHPKNFLTGNLGCLASDLFIHMGKAFSRDGCFRVSYLFAVKPWSHLSVLVWLLCLPSINLCSLDLHTGQEHVLYEPVFPVLKQRSLLASRLSDFGLRLAPKQSDNRERRLGWGWCKHENSWSV